jgi:hypothetical protein
MEQQGWAEGSALLWGGRALQAIPFSDLCDPPMLCDAGCRPGYIAKPTTPSELSCLRQRCNSDYEEYIFSEEPHRAMAELWLNFLGY